MEKHPQQPVTGHEVRDARVRPIVLTGVGLAIGAAIVCVLVYGIFAYLAAHPTSTARSNPLAATAPQFPPAPRLEEHPAVQLQDLRTKEDSVLSSYGWSDKQAGIVRVPVDRAMELMLQRGFPVREEAKSTRREAHKK
jgi:hypothetical protein